MRQVHVTAEIGYLLDSGFFLVPTDKEVNFNVSEAVMRVVERSGDMGNFAHHEGMRHRLDIEINCVIVYAIMNHLSLAMQ
jgi:hypothetical protein